MVERIPDKNEVEGSIPSSPTKSKNSHAKEEVEGPTPSAPTSSPHIYGVQNKLV